ncbi:MAG: 1-acyl-sn-glycerol-3-phosphate acyltransferase [Clostridia bacterium]|nr:1-acyl-sn-glycerol-3-phosphate acyltransferase [Clostridia bacterium]
MSFTNEKDNVEISSNINYRNKKHYKTAKYPIRQPKFFTWLIWVLSKMMLRNKEKKIEKINMEGLKPPYMLLGNHMAFVDFEMLSLATYPQRMNNVVNIDGFYRRPWLLEWIGSIATRKYSQDLHLIKSIKKVLNRGDVLTMYPEARYSPIGTTGVFPDSLANLIKKNKVPVVVACHHGHHLFSPVWDHKKKRKVPFYTTLTQVLTAEQIEEMSVDKINEIIRKALEYDDYKYQKDNGILIKEPYRAEGLHKVLYQCPNCMTEFKMSSKGSEIFCEECGKRWTWREDGYLEALEGKTEFDHIPDWYEWERSQVRKEIEEGKYAFDDEVDLYGQPHCWKYRSIGKGRLTHNLEEGFVITGEHRGQKFRKQWTPLETIAIYVEYDLERVKKADSIALSTSNDTIYCFPNQQPAVSKLCLAAEEMYKINYEKTKKYKNKKITDK